MKKDKPIWFRDLKESVCIIVILSVVFAISLELDTPINPSCVKPFSKRITLPVDTCVLGDIFKNTTNAILWLTFVAVLLFALSNNLNLIRDISDKYRIGNQLDEIFDEIFPPNRVFIDSQIEWHTKQIIELQKHKRRSK